MDASNKVLEPAPKWQSAPKAIESHSKTGSSDFKALQPASTTASSNPKFLQATTTFTSKSQQPSLTVDSVPHAHSVSYLLDLHAECIYSAPILIIGAHPMACPRTVRLWDVGTGQLVGEPFCGHPCAVTSVSLSPDGTRLFSGSDDKTVWLWNVLGTGQPVVSFSPNGTRIATCSADKTIRLWDASTGQPVGEPFLGHTETVNSISFSPDGTRIVSGSDDETVRLWDVGTGQPIGEPFEGHTDWVRSVSFSWDGTRIVFGSDDKTVQLCDAATGQSVGEPLLGHSRWVNLVLFSPDGTRIILVHGMRLYESGTQRLGIRCMTTPKTVQHPPHIAVVSHTQQQPSPHPTLRTMNSFPSHQTRLVHCAALLSYSQAPPMMTAGQRSLFWKMMDG
ncbi:hypothetical protein CY34DRAFT_13835 [Suillus luteus UH-Slu-Lm8-n1]|uniref:WD40 repeat-like protein n=1 Tax=Suillus luteus UH-Slu-Lm8-n1 TaxID=930992 RepID=A0A0C9ZR99_9AGAM|nr:hypothetical protein CY34DRAFT_13835 [Suillus luteus UH-Slu-Lm8-n1]